MIRHRLRALLFDMDGVLYRGRQPLPGARALIGALQTAGVPLALVTNNSTRSPHQYVRHLAAIGMRVPAGQIVTSSVGTATYLRTVLRPRARVLVIGEPALRRAVMNAGFDLVWRDAAAVVVGLDRRVTYKKLALALASLSRGAVFVATNPDPMLPTEGGLLPGAGSIVAALRFASGREPVVIGKPDPRLLREAMTRIGTRPEHTAMVGDQRSTDIAAGRAAGVFTILVMTGVEASRRAGRGAPRPDLTVQTLVDLRRWLAGRLAPASTRAATR